MIMKRIVFFILVFSMFITACATKQTNSSDISLDTLVNDITKEYGLTDGFVFTSSSDELGEYLDDDLILSYYGDATDVPDFSKISDYCVYIDESDANVIIDVGIFHMKDTSYGKVFAEYIQTRIDDKIEDSEEYPTIDVPTLEAGVIGQEGEYVYYVVSYDVDEIVKDIEAALKQ